MARVRLNLRSMSVSEKIAKSRHVVTSMTDNKNFPSPTPPLTEVLMVRVGKRSTEVRGIWSGSSHRKTWMTISDRCAEQTAVLNLLFKRGLRRQT